MTESLVCDQYQHFSAEVIQTVLPKTGQQNSLQQNGHINAAEMTVLSEIAETVLENEVKLHLNTQHCAVELDPMIGAWFACESNMQICFPL